MKRYVAMIISFVMVIGLLAACGGNQGSAQTDGSTGPSESATSGATDFPKVKLTLGHVGPGTPDGHLQVFSEKFKEVVEKETNGSVTIEIMADAKMGGEREMVEQVQFGSLDIVFTSSGPIGNFAPLLNALDFPFLFENREHVHEILDSEIGVEMTKELEEQGLKLLAWGENGFRNITNNKRPVKTLSDIEGLKLRTQENKIHMATFKAYGANPTPMSFAELFTSMQQGVVDGQENPMAIIISSKFYEVQKYLSLSQHVYSPMMLLINTDKFNGFPPELQRVLLDAGIVARDHELDFIKQKEEEFIQIAKDNGMEVVMPEEFDRESFLGAMGPVYAEFEQQYGDILNKINSAR